MQRITYKDYIIIATAFQDEEGKWVGQAELRALGDNPVAIQNPMAFNQQTFEDEKEAEDFAADGAQIFIDTAQKDSGME